VQYNAYASASLTQKGVIQFLTIKLNRIKNVTNISLIQHSFEVRFTHTQTHTHKHTHTHTHTNTHTHKHTHTNTQFYV